MRIFVPREIETGETRVALVPEAVQKLAGLGMEISIEAGLGGPISIPDETYERTGAEVGRDRSELLGAADVVLRVRKPPENEVALLKRESIHVSLLDPFNEPDGPVVLVQSSMSSHPERKRSRVEATVGCDRPTIAALAGKNASLPYQSKDELPGTGAGSTPFVTRQLVLFSLGSMDGAAWFRLGSPSIGIPKGISPPSLTEEVEARRR